MSGRTRPVHWLQWAAASAALSLGAAACSQYQPCRSVQTIFSEQVWSSVMGKTCITCHGPGGVAQEQGAKFKLVPTSYPGFVDANLENIRKVAQLEVNGVSTILLKPLGRLDHGGGVVLQEGSAEYQSLVTLVQQLKSPSACEERKPEAFQDVAQLEAAATLRKASLSLVGRLPTPGEVERVRIGGMSGLDGVLDEMMKEEAFFDRLKEMFNDFLLTDRYLSYSSRAVGLLNRNDFPNAGDAWFNQQSNDVRYYANLAIGREPLEIIAHVVRNDRPFSEILTADYTVVDPYSAQVYGVDYNSVATSSAGASFKEMRLTVPREGQDVPIPHAGVLTTPAFLNRFPTTRTNRNRHRARMVLQLFLATDILKVGSRPIDPTASTAFNNPTRDDPACVTCHATIDPIAGGFQTWDVNDQERYRPDREWFQEMFPPGFGEEVMPASEFPSATRWLAQRIAGDPRFAQSVVQTVFTSLVGHAPLEYPGDLAAPDYPERLRAWQAQDDVFQTVKAAYQASGENLKTVIKEIVKSPYFRAANAVGPVTAQRETELEGVGGGRLLTPEMLHRKIAATTGIPWRASRTSTPYLLGTYRLLYGGIDSDGVTQRLTAPNGVMIGVAARMANEVACAATGWDFTKPAASRLLFPLVTLEHVPIHTTGDPIPGAIADIKENIRHLHEQLLGEGLGVEDPEIEATYQLFLNVWKDGQQAIATEEESEWLPSRCRARSDPFTGESLPSEERVERDPSYTVRAWMAVMTYLLSDYRFLYE